MKEARHTPLHSPVSKGEAKGVAALIAPDILVLLDENPASIPAETEEIDVSGRFGEVAERRYSWDVTYTAPEYLDLLRTYSGHRALPPHDLQGLLGCIAALIEERYNGRITKRYLTRTVVAYRKA